MVSETVGEIWGKTAGLRVLPFDEKGAKVEFAWQGGGKVLGVDVTEMGTAVCALRPGGMLYCDGQAIWMTKEGETVPILLQGIQKPTGHGTAANFRGAGYLQSAPQKLARLSGIPCQFEVEIDENGNYRGKLSESK